MYCGTPTERMGQCGGLSALSKSSDGKAVASLICGIISLLTSGGLFIVPTVGVLLSLSSEPSGIARTGLYLNALAFVPAILFVFGS